MNAVKFLVSGVYQGGEELMTEANHEQILEKETFARKIGGREIEFDIYDSVTSFVKNDWKRVVAVFVAGPEWQFKDWPSKEKIVDIFQKVRGYYLHFAEMPVPKAVSSWNVKRFELNKRLRHEDKAVQILLWKDLAAWLLRERVKSKQRRDEM